MLKLHVAGTFNGRKRERIITIPLREASVNYRKYSQDDQTSLSAFGFLRSFQHHLDLPTDWIEVEWLEGKWRIGVFVLNEGIPTTVTYLETEFIVTILGDEDE